MKLKSTILFTVMTFLGLFYVLSDDSNKAYAAEFNTNGLEVLHTENELIEPLVVLTRHYMELTLSSTTGTTPRFIYHQKAIDGQPMAGWLELYHTEPTGQGMKYYYRGYLYNTNLGPVPMPAKIEPEV